MGKYLNMWESCGNKWEWDGMGEWNGMEEWNDGQFSYDGSFPHCRSLRCKEPVSEAWMTHGTAE